MTSCVPHHLVFPGEAEDGKAHFGERGGQGKVRRCQVRQAANDFRDNLEFVPVL